ncbi:hypothetical protein [Flagellimonas sp.]
MKKVGLTIVAAFVAVLLTSTIASCENDSIDQEVEEVSIDNDEVKEDDI